ncbi:MAG: MFS transporter [Chthoniobacter sp.]
MNPTAAKAWLAVLSIALGAFVVVTSEFLPIGLLTHIATGLHVSDGTAGLMVTIPGLVAAFAAPVMTIAAGRFDRRHVVLGLIALLAVANLTAAFAPNFGVMIAARVLFGISLGGFWTIAVTLGGRLVPARSMAKATTIILAGISIATVAGVPAGTLIAGLSSWRVAFAVIGGVALLVGVVQLFVLPALPPPPAPGFRQLTHLLRHADARLGLLTVAFVVAGHFGAYTYVAPFLRDGSGISAGSLSTLLLAYGVAGVVGNFVGGAAAARHLKSTLLGVVLLQTGAILLLPVIGHQLAGATVLLIAWGLAFGAVPITLQLWVFKSAPEALEGGAALLVSTFQIVIATGSVLGGVIVDHFGTSAVMWSGGATSLAALGIVALSQHSPKTSAVRAQPDLA